MIRTYQILSFLLANLATFGGQALAAELIPEASIARLNEVSSEVEDVRFWGKLRDLAENWPIVLTAEALTEERSPLVVASHASAREAILRFEARFKASTAHMVSQLNASEFADLLGSIDHLRNNAMLSGGYLNVLLADELLRISAAQLAGRFWRRPEERTILKDKVESLSKWEAPLDLIVRAFIADGAKIEFEINDEHREQIRKSTEYSIADMAKESIRKLFSRAVLAERLHKSDSIDLKTPTGQRRLAVPTNFSELFSRTFFSKAFDRIRETERFTGLIVAATAVIAEGSEASQLELAPKVLVDELCMRRQGQGFTTEDIFEEDLESLLSWVGALQRQKETILYGMN